ncbi:hypothetical protein Tco_0393322 [Tanacetum coccineum]
MIAKAILQEHGNIQAEISSQIQNAIDNHIPSQVDASKNFEYEAYVSGESSSGQVNENKQGPSTSGNQEQEDDYDFWTESYAADDDEIPTKLIGRSIVSSVVYYEVPDYAETGLLWSLSVFITSSVIWERVHDFQLGIESYQQKVNLTALIISFLGNDIEDMYLLIMNGKVPDYAETWLLWSLSVFIRSSVIWERVHDFQLGIESYQQKVNLTAPTISFPGINKFCDATLNKVLEGLRSYNNDVKYGYIQRDLTNEEVEYLKLFEEEIEVSKSDENMGDKYLADINLHVYLEEIKVYKTLCFVEEPVEIIDHEVESLKRSRIPIVKSIGTRSESCYAAIRTLVWASEVVSIKSRDEISLRRGYYDNCALSSYACSDSLLLTPLCCDDIHDVTPHVSALAGCDKCYADEPLAVQLDGLHIDDKLHFIEEPVEIMDRKVKRLKRSRILIVKV